MLRKQNRFNKKEINSLFEKRISFSLLYSVSFLVRIYKLENLNSKVAVIIPKKFLGNRSAAKRNAIRRFIYEQFREKINKFGCIQFIFMFKNSRTDLDVASIKREINEFFKSNEKDIFTSSVVS